MLRAVIMGLPGSGKGTLCHRIIKDFDIYHLSSGDLLRSHMESKTEIGITAKRFIDTGHLVPDGIITELIASELHDVGQHPCILDGFPRTRIQAEHLQKKEPVNLVINLVIPIPVIVDRIAGRMTHIASGRTYNKHFNPPKIPGRDDVTGEPLVVRDDDLSEMVTKRLETFQEQTSHAISYYRKLDIINEFHGETTNQLWPAVHKFLSQYLKPLHFTSYA